MAARVRVLITLHRSTQFCSMEPNKRECQSQTHLGARCCISVTLINDTEAEWEHDTVMDSPPQLMKLGEFDIE